MTTRRATLLAGTLAATLAAAAACSGPDTSEPSGTPAVTSATDSRLADVECPGDVADAAVAPVECYELTVPERHADPSGRTVKVFVTIVRAPAGSPDAEPVLVTALANTPNYGGIAPMAQRVRRDVILVDTRGTGHSTPGLGCPEVTELAPAAWSAPTNDPSQRDALLRAVGGCHDRLVSEGTDVASYDLVEAAADLRALRAALGVPAWDVTAYGVGSRLALELLRQEPDPIRALVLDSPEVPGTDPRSLAGPTTARAVRAVLGACAEDPACALEHPRPESLLDDALAELQRRPVDLRVDYFGKKVPLRFDAGVLARLLRQMLSDGASSGLFFQPATIPDLLAAVAQRRADLALEAGTAIRFEGPLCLGYRTPCLPAGATSMGVELTVMCRDIAPFVDDDTSRLGPGFREAYGESPWWRLCESWPVPPQVEEVAARPSSGVPTLVALGRFAPYSPEARVRDDLAGLSAASYVVVPGRAHNVLPRGCAGEIRGTWLDDPEPFTENPCKEEEEIPWR